MSEQSQIRVLVEAYLEDAKHHKGRDGKVRSQNTMAGYREAARRFADAVESKGLSLDQLPPDFLHTDWLQLLQHRWHQPVQLRVRSYAVQGLIKWLHEHNIPVAPLIPVKVQTPDARTMTADLSGEEIEDIPPEESNMPQPILNDFTTEEVGGDAQLPMMQQQALPQMPQMAQMQPVMRQMPSNISMPSQGRIPAPISAPPAVQKPPARANPLAHLLPTAGYRLRVRRERDLEEPVWVGDYPAEQVVVHGAIEPFLAKVAANKLPGVSGDVAFQVCPIGPDGREGDRSRVTIAVLGGPVAPTPTAAAPTQATGLNEIADLLSFHRKSQDELEGRIANIMQQQQQPYNFGSLPNFTGANIPLPNIQPPQQQFGGYGQQQPSPQDDIRMALSEMQRGMALMAERIAELSNPAPQPQQAPQLDVLAIIDRVGGMMRSAQPTEPAKSAAGSMGEVFQMMAQAKQIFAPANVNVDVSPLEDELKNVRAELAAVKSQGQKKDELLEFAEKAKALQSLFGGAGPFTTGSSAGKPAGSIGAALGGLIEKVVENPEPIANAIERVLNGMARMKESAVAQEMARPPAATPGQGLEPRVKHAIETLLRAQGDGAIVTSAMELMRVLDGTPSTKPVAEQIAKRLTAGNEVELVAFLRQVFTRLGYGHVATPDRLQAIVTPVMKQIRASQQPPQVSAPAATGPVAEPEQEGDDEEFDEDGEEFDEDDLEGEEDGEEVEDVDEGPDELMMEADAAERLKGSTLNIRVGGTREDEEYEDEDEPEDDQPEDEPEEEEPVVEVAPEPPPKRKRGRPSKAELAARE